MHCFSVCCFLIVDCFVSLSDSCSLRSARILFGLTQRLGILTEKYFVKRRGEVKIILLRDEWLIAVERWLKRVDTWFISDRRRSKTGDRWEPVQGTLNSTFLKRGTFIVLNLNGCCFCQWMNFSLARDAYNAYSRKAGHCQGLFFQYQKLKGSWDKSYWNNTCLGD